MIPGPTMLVACPLCDHPAMYFTLTSGNTIGAIHWTDGKLEAPMLPQPPAVARCPGCGECYWLETAPSFGSAEPRSEPDPHRTGAGHRLSLYRNQRRRSTTTPSRAVWRLRAKKRRSSVSSRGSAAMTHTATRSSQARAYEMLRSRDGDEISRNSWNSSTSASLTSGYGRPKRTDTLDGSKKQGHWFFS